MRKVVPETGYYYQHYKGGIYKVHAIGRHTETEEQMVFYSDNDGKWWARPLVMWVEYVEYEGKIVARFTRL